MAELFPTSHKHFLKETEMPETRSDFWNYLETWKKIFHERRKLFFSEGSVENDYCRDCRFCCGPQGNDEPFPMALLPKQVGPENINDFYMLNFNTAYLGAEGCKSITPHGCRLPHPKRPMACGLFPIVLVNGGLYLYKCCPAVLFTPLVEFAQFGLEVEKELKKLSLDELKHISLDLPENVLVEKYINLLISIF